MKACPFCAEQIQDAAVLCRFCNRNLPPASTALITAIENAPPTPAVRPVFKVLGFLILALIAYGFLNELFEAIYRVKPGATNVSSAENNGTWRPPNGQQVSAIELYEAYHANEVSANAAYKGKILQVDGVVQSINTDFMSRPYLILFAKNEFSGVHATFPRNTPATVLGGVAIADFVTVQCTGNGMILGSPVLDDCSLQEWMRGTVR